MNIQALGDAIVEDPETISLLLDRLPDERAIIQQHETSLVPALARWVDSEEHGVDALVALALLDTHASVAYAVEHVADAFTRRETGGHERVIDAIDRTTQHAVFPQLARPLEKQQSRQLLWDRWHVATGAAIARLATALHGAGRVTSHPLAGVTAELEMLLQGGERCCTTLLPGERRAFEAVAPGGVRHKLHK